MNDKTLQRKLNQLAKLCNELDEEAKLRYGPAGFLFFESEGDFHLMDGDENPDIGSALNRQWHIRFSSTICCQLGAGAW